MAEFFAVSRENLNDAFLVDHLDPRDAALIEPLACVVKSLEKVGFDFSTSSGATDSEDEVPYLSPGTLTDDEDKPCAVIGLGVMGLMHMLLLPDGSVGFETNPARRAWAQGLGLVAQAPNADHKFETIFVCPGSEEALNLALEIAAPGASVVLFAPMPPGGPTPVDLNRVYFSEISLIPCYSCGPNDTVHAAEILDGGLVQAHQVVSDFIELDGLPAAYLAMKQGEILKPMVMFPSV
jgi:threonine dehydrogenase-like Zn-dependent dehydrogenase